MKKKSANLYVKLTAKSAILFVLLILLSVTFILYITINTKVDVVRTYEGRIEGNQIIINNIRHYKLDKIYVYVNRNESVYTVDINKNLTFDNNCMIIDYDVDKFQFTSNLVKVDIPIKKVTLFERVFMRGGKNE